MQLLLFTTVAPTVYTFVTPSASHISSALLQLLILLSVLLCYDRFIVIIQKSPFKGDYDIVGASCYNQPAILLSHIIGSLVIFLLLEE